MSYDYGPPVENEGESGSPASNPGEIVDNEGESPHTPPDNTSEVFEPGGSPSEESGTAPEPEPTLKPADDE